MNPDLKKYRLNTMSEVVAFRKTEGFDKYFAAMKTWLQSLPYKTTFDIVNNIPEKNWDRFVKTACVYIVSQRLETDEVLFTDDYRGLYRQRVI